MSNNRVLLNLHNTVHESLQIRLFSLLMHGHKFETSENGMFESSTKSCRETHPSQAFLQCV